MYLDDLRVIDATSFVRIMSLEAFNPDFIIPSSIIEQYEMVSSAEKMQLDEQYKVGRVLASSLWSGRTSLLFIRALRSLAAFLHCGEDLDTVLKIRNDRSNDFDLYVKELFKDVRIHTLILSDYRDTDRSAVVRKSCPARLMNKVVLHPLIFSALDRSVTFTEAINYFDFSLEQYVKKEGYIGIKSMVAYGGNRKRSGLDIGNPDEKSAAEAFRRYKDRKGNIEGYHIKDLIDYFHRLAIEKSIRFDIPFEFHTGIGDLEVLTDRCNPMLLANLLKDEEIRHAKIILLHGGYPYVAEAAWMAHFFPNVYLDASILFFTHLTAAVRRIEEALEMVPYGKLLYSSDGYGIPELHWFGAKEAKRAITIALGNLVHAGTLSEKESLSVAEAFFYRNAKELYRL